MLQIKISLACFLHHSLVVMCMHSEVLLCYSIKQRKGLGAREGSGDPQTEPGKCSTVQFEGKQYEGRNVTSGTLQFLKSQLHANIFSRMDASSYVTEKKHDFLFLSSAPHFNPVACPVEIPDLILEHRHAMC